MHNPFDIPLNALLGQLILGLVSGAFYALLSLGLAVIFGMLNIINFAHGAFYMMGAIFCWMLLEYFHMSFGWALIIVPVVMAVVGVLVDQLMLKRLRGQDHLYGLLLTFGLALVLEGLFRQFYGTAGLPYDIPQALSGSIGLGFMNLPLYRAFVIVVSTVLCFATWYIIEKTYLGSRLRAATENPALTQALGINVPLMVTLTYAGGVMLASVAGVLAAPALQVSPLMGSNLIIVVFAVVVIGGMGSILGAIVSGLALGLIEGLAKVIYPEISATVVFIIMVIILMMRPSGLFGTQTS